MAHRAEAEPEPPFSICIRYSFLEFNVPQKFANI